jgi:hypothetical protein
MESFYKTLGVVLALCIGIGVMTLFFWIINLIKKVDRKVNVLKMEGFITEGRYINVHLSTGKIYRNIKFIGFTEKKSEKDAMPYQLWQMMVCETAKGAKVLIRTDTVRVIEEIEDTA